MERTSGSGRLLLAAGLACAAAARPSFAAARDWKAGALIDYETGKFGTATRTDTVYIPFTLRRYWTGWYASLTAPFLSQTRNSQVTNVGGMPTRIRNSPGSTSTSNTTSTESGLGDLIARTGYYLMDDGPRSCDLTVVGKLKMPTADRDKGLGTGEFDEGFGLEFGKVVVGDWTLLADLYYTFIGSPPGTDLNDQVLGDAGFSRPLIKDLKLTVLFEESNALVSGAPAPADLRGILDFKMNDRARVYGGLLAGLSDGSPDVGVSLGASYRF